MELPVYQEIILKSLIPEYLEKVFEGANPGKVPLYVVLEATLLSPEEELKNLLDDCQKIFDRMNVHPRFPYPIYFILPQIIYHPTIPVITSEAFLPKLFNGKKKGLNTKESNLLTKISIDRTLLKNNLNKDKFAILEERAALSRELFQIVRENDFLKTILNKLKK